MSDPIQPTNVTLSNGTPTTPGPVIPPQPTAPPTVGMPTTPAGPGNWWRGAGTDTTGGNAAGGGGTGGGGTPPTPASAPVPVPAPGGGGWGAGGGGVALVPAPAYAPPVPVTYVAQQIIVAGPPAPAPAPRFDVRRVRPVSNGLALVIGAVVARVVWNPILYVFGDQWGVVLAGFTGALVLEWRFRGQRVWPVRLLTCSWIAAAVVTPAGLLGLGFLGTGA